MAFVKIPAGEFKMGSEKGRDDEQPVHRVRISQGFDLDRGRESRGRRGGSRGASDRARIGGTSNIPLGHAKNIKVLSQQILNLFVGLDSVRVVVILPF